MRLETGFYELAPAVFTDYKAPMEWLDKIPTGLLIAAAILMALAPFSPEPHLVEKYRMFMAGNLRKPLDIFDVFWHLLPSALLALKLFRSA